MSEIMRSVFRPYLIILMQRLFFICIFENITKSLIVLNNRLFLGKSWYLLSVIFQILYFIIAFKFKNTHKFSLVTVLVWKSTKMYNQILLFIIIFLYWHSTFEKIYIIMFSRVYYNIRINHYKTPHITQNIK